MSGYLLPLPVENPLAPQVARASSGSAAADHGEHHAQPTKTHTASGSGEQAPTAGDLMQTKMATFDALALVADVIEDFKTRQGHGELPSTIYVVDESGEFVGTLSSARLLMAKPESVLDLLISGQPVSIPVDSGVEEIARAAQKHHLKIIPVTDSHDRLVGLVDAAALPADHGAPASHGSHAVSPIPIEPIKAAGHHPVSGGQPLDNEHSDGSPAPADAGQHAAASVSPGESHTAAGHAVQPAAHGSQDGHGDAPHAAKGTTDSHGTAAAESGKHGGTPAHGDAHAPVAGHGETSDPQGHAPAAAESHGTDTGHAPPADAHGGGHGAEPAEPKAKGVAFVEATIAPLEYELNHRFYGWRPNDIFDFSDNVNNFQLGVLEVSRRSVVVLAERVSRTGAIEAFNENVENAMNWLMIKSNRYWLPSPESKFQAALDELAEYARGLERGEAGFYNRTDNLIPLLAAYEDLLGSCEENLVKHLEEDGSPVSFFKADDYFFYAQGVASAMGTILAAVHHDFHDVLVARNGIEVLHHAVESCHHAVEINPWVITDSDYSGIFANHRANLAAPLSHARFYLAVLIKTLST